MRESHEDKAPMEKRWKVSIRALLYQALKNKERGMFIRVSK